MKRKRSDTNLQQNSSGSDESFIRMALKTKMWEEFKLVMESARPDSKQNQKRTRLKLWGKLGELKEDMEKSANFYQKGQPATAEEYTRIVLVVASAICNPCDFIRLLGIFGMADNFVLHSVQTGWDVERLAEAVKGYSAQSNEDVEQSLFSLKKYFPLESFPPQEEPCTLVDQHGRILIWHLPDIIWQPRLDDINSATKILKDKLDMGSTDEKSWRKDGFRPGEEFGAGTKRFSPGWFMRGRAQLHEKLRASGSVQDDLGEQYLSAMIEPENIFNAVLSLITPDLYDVANEAIEKVKSGDGMARDYENIELWQSCYTALEVIVNRTTPPHRDRGAAAEQFDLLVSAGTHKKADLDIPELDLSLSYGPGCIVVLCGRVFLHAVKDWSGGERICIAHFIKDTVHNRLQVRRPFWPKISDYV